MGIGFSSLRATRPESEVEGERGESLTEVLITVMLMGLVVTAVLMALFVLVRTAALNKEKTRTAVVLQTAAEKTKSAVGDMEYQFCGTPASYQSALNSELALSSDTDVGVRGYSVEVKDVRFATGTWKGAGSGDLGTFTSFCGASQMDGGLQRDSGVQQLTLQVTSDAEGQNHVTEQIIVTKRDARCPEVIDEGYQNPDMGPC